MAATTVDGPRSEVLEGHEDLLSRARRFNRAEEARKLRLSDESTAHKRRGGGLRFRNSISRFYRGQEIAKCNSADLLSDRSGST